MWSWFKKNKKPVEYIHKTTDWGYETICHCNPIPLRFLRIGGQNLDICPICGCKTQSILGRVEWDIPKSFGFPSSYPPRPYNPQAINVKFVIKPEGCQKGK